MVLKLCNRSTQLFTLFENDVKMYGTQTSGTNVKVENQFENDVKMYGTQTTVYGANDGFKFENDVKMYGTQTIIFCRTCMGSLRMM